ncbi:MAG: tail fiber domain-containing protein [Saprospiraceae bacterium]|nr:tail fiber domain-containing protein [Saprospiraceae bacterium]
MPSKRSELRNRFNPANNAVPNGNDYAALINSVLNLRDDQFYGVWRPDGIYYTGAVVLFNKAFYVLETTPDTPFCSETDPKSDNRSWKRIEEKCADDDWFLSEDPEHPNMWANKKVRLVGIGTSNPQATLDVSARGKGKIKLQPGFTNPELEILNLDPACKENKVILRVTTKAAQVDTDSPHGLDFIKTHRLPILHQVHVMNVDATDTHEPRVGIGTRSPDAFLHVQKNGDGFVKVDFTEQESDPFIRIAKPEHSSLRLVAREKSVAIVSKSEKGLLFQRRVDKDELDTQVVISAHGNVGIGTEHPKAKLHIETRDARDGAIKLGFCATYPVLHLVNNKVPDKSGNYYNSFAAGTSTEAAVLKTDSHKGFAFKKPGKETNEEHLVSDLNDGITLVRIYPNGTMTVGNLNASDYRLDVDGVAHATGLYLHADRRDIDLKNCEELGEVLPRLCALNPLRFRWKEGPLEHEPDKWEIGLLADEVKPQFEEVVVDNSIAYQNLVPVLVKAIQEQQAMIDELKEEVRRLKKHGGHHSHHSEEEEY